MKDQNIKIDLGAVQETLILPLWARAKEMEKKNPIVYDTYARDIVARIDYDFSKIEVGQVADHQKAANSKFQMTKIQTNFKFQKPNQCHSVKKFLKILRVIPANAGIS